MLFIFATLVNIALVFVLAKQEIVCSHGKINFYQYIHITDRQTYKQTDRHVDIKNKDDNINKCKALKSNGSANEH